MTDLEMTRLCAEAMGLTITATLHDAIQVQETVCGIEGYERDYFPLHDDAQAMALVKKFLIDVYPRHWDDNEGKWGCEIYCSHTVVVVAKNDDLNRAIVECVAKMQKGEK